MNKIITLEQLDSIKRGGRKLVLVGGCFDIFHIGHLHFLQQAKRAGDILLVCLESNARVNTLKGVNRPIHDQSERAQILAALEVVDYVLLLPNMSGDKAYTDLINNIRPSIIAVTQNDPIKDKKKLQAKTVGGKLAEIFMTKTPSTQQLTRLLNID